MCDEKIQRVIRAMRKNKTNVELVLGSGKSSALGANRMYYKSNRSIAIVLTEPSAQTFAVWTGGASVLEPVGFTGDEAIVLS